MRPGKKNVEGQKNNRAVSDGTKPRDRDTLRSPLHQHGDVIHSEHPLLELAVDLHNDENDEIGRQPLVGLRAVLKGSF
jgi:hypothetical protein